MRVKKKIVASFLTAGLVCLSPINVAAANESVTFGSEEYESKVDGEFPVGIYMASDEVISSYEFQIQYDPNRLTYEGTAEVDEEMGIISMSGNGNSTGSVRERLEFTVINGGEAFIQVVSATFQLEDGSEVMVSDLGSAPIHLEGDDTVAAAAEITPLPQGTFYDGESIPEAPETDNEPDQVESEISDTPEVPDIENEQATSDIPEEDVNESSLPEENSEDTENNDQGFRAKIKGILEAFGNFGGVLLFEAIAILLCLLLIIATILHRNKVKARRRRAAQKKKKAGRQTASEWAEEFSGGIKAAPVKEKPEAETVSDEKKASKAKAADKKEPQKKKVSEVSKGQIDSEKQVSLVKDVAGEQGNLTQGNTGQADKVKDEQPVISVQHVTMDFHVSTSNASGFKEYLIQRIKRQISYRDFRALNDISFDVFKGEVVGIIGTNGSGKSTLLRIVSGALRPTSGKVVVDRQKVQLLTLGTGFDMELTAKENVYLNGAIIGYSKEFLDAHYDEIVEFAELHDFMEEKVKNFSSGMVSRLGFSIATAGGAAEILILDEVLSVGDEFFRKKSLARIKEMIHGGSTVLMVSHGMGTILDNCTKVVWIEKGDLRMIGEPKEVCAAYRKMNG